MISVEEAKKIGVDACIDRIGRDLCREYADNATSAYGLRDNYLDCFVGVNDVHDVHIDLNSVTELVLTHEKDWKYSAECSVDMDDGRVIFN